MLVKPGSMLLKVLRVPIMALNVLVKSMGVLVKAKRVLVKALSSEHACKSCESVPRIRENASPPTP